MSGAGYTNGGTGTVVATAQQRERPPADVLRGQLVAMSGEFKNALPAHISPEKFQRVVMTVVQQSPDLLNADRRSLLASCTKCAADGLIPDGREAALVLFGGKVQYMPMMGGIQKRVRNSGAVSGIEAHIIYEHDAFVWRQGLARSIEHTPKFPGDRGKPIGAYAVARFKDGSDPQFEVMDVAAIEKVRAVSRAKGTGPWVAWWDEMARKTVFRRLSKWLPMDADVDDLMRRDVENEVSAGGGVTLDGEVASQQQQIGAPSKLDAFDNGPTLTGEVLDAEVVDVPPRVTSPIDSLIAEIEACENEALLRKWESNAEVRVRIRALSAEDGEAITRATQAQRMGFGGRGGR